MDRYPVLAADDTRKDTLAMERATDEGSALNMRDIAFEHNLGIGSLRDSDEVTDLQAQPAAAILARA